MPTVDRVLTIPLNLRKLHEELTAAALPLTGMNAAGYEQETPRKFVPRSANHVYTRRVIQGQVTVLTAGPGEVFFEFGRTLTGAQTTEFDRILAAHDFTALIAEQVKDDDIAAKLADIKATLAASQTLSAAQLSVFAEVMIHNENL